MALARTILLNHAPFAAATFAMATSEMHEIRQILTDHVCATEQSTWYVVSLVSCFVLGSLKTLLDPVYMSETQLYLELYFDDINLYTKVLC